MSMFCFQCQEAAKGTGCTVRGVCGKPDDTARLQDLLIYVLKGISWCRREAEKYQFSVESADRFLVESLFATITNANFDNTVIEGRITKALEIRDRIQDECVSQGVSLDKAPGAVTWKPSSPAEYDLKAASVGVLATENEDIRSLRELLTYGVKGIAAYYEHAHNLGFENHAVTAFVEQALAATLDDSLSADDLVNLVMECGKNGVDVMALLDSANTSTYGSPEITEVSIGTADNPAILISGHDLKDMQELLEQTEGTGVDVYTHSEMLPANYYPAFKKYEHLRGNYGNAWWKQKEEFETFNGPILFTTNCIVPPKDSYKDRV